MFVDEIKLEEVSPAAIFNQAKELVHVSGEGIDAKVFFYRDSPSLIIEFVGGMRYLLNISDFVEDVWQEHKWSLFFEGEN